MPDTNGTHEATQTAERPELLIFCAIVAVIGMIAPLATSVWATLITDHNTIADTISDLARGPNRAIMDTGFYLHAAGLLALAIAAAHAHLGKTGWSIGIFCIAFLALIVVLLGLWDEFHTAGDNPPGMTVHTKLTFFLGPLFLAGPLFMASGAARAAPIYHPLFIASAVLWAVFAAAFKLAPTGYDGILEKVAVVGSMVWTVPLSLLFLKRGLERMGEA